MPAIHTVLAGLGASLAESAHDTSSSPEVWQFFDVECQKAGLWCTAAGSRREAEEAVQF